METKCKQSTRHSLVPTLWNFHYCFYIEAHSVRGTFLAGLVKTRRVIKPVFPATVYVVDFWEPPRWLFNLANFTIESNKTRRRENPRCIDQADTTGVIALDQFTRRNFLSLTNSSCDVSSPQKAIRDSVRDCTRVYVELSSSSIPRL